MEVRLHRKLKADADPESSQDSARAFKKVLQHTLEMKLALQTDLAHQTQELLAFLSHSTRIQRVSITTPSWAGECLACGCVLDKEKITYRDPQKRMTLTTCRAL